IIDNGVRIDHDDLKEIIWVNDKEIPGNNIDDDSNGYVDDVNGYDVADKDEDPTPPTAGLLNTSHFNHGTHCSGIASGATDNGTGMASIGFGTTVIPVKCAKDV